MSSERRRRARQEALLRSGNRCQFCGLRDADEVHHWELHYTPDDQLTASHLTALCAACHSVATAIRRAEKAGVEMWAWKSAFERSIATCCTPSLSREPPDPPDS